MVYNMFYRYLSSLSFWFNYLLYRNAQSISHENNIKVEQAIKRTHPGRPSANKVAVSRQTINAMEANKYVPSTVLALKIAGIRETC